MSENITIPHMLVVITTGELRTNFFLGTSAKRLSVAASEAIAPRIRHQFAYNYENNYDNVLSYGTSNHRRSDVVCERGGALTKLI